MSHARHAARASALALLLVGSGAHAAEGPAPTAPAFSEAAFRAHVDRISSDEFEGRAPGTAGEQKTLAYIEREFRRYRECGVSPTASLVRGAATAATSCRSRSAARDVAYARRAMPGAWWRRRRRALAGLDSSGSGPISRNHSV